MKTLALAFVAALATTGAYAAETADFSDNKVTTTFTSGNLEFSLDFGSQDLEGVTTRAYTSFGQVGAFDTWTAVELGYDRIDETLSVAAIGAAQTQLDPNWTLWGQGEVAYVAATQDLGEGEALVTPTFGVSYSLTEATSVSASVDHTWVATQSWEAVGGEGEVAVSHTFRDNLLVTGSLVKPYDTKNDAAYLKLETVFSF